MSDFTFLKDYCDNMPSRWKCGCEFKNGLSRAEIQRLAAQVQIAVPTELMRFYEWSYGAKLCEYQIYTIPQIADTLVRLRTVYGRYERATILPFGYFHGVGDYVAFDVADRRDDKIAIVDGFHELSPDEWKIVTYGLEHWLRELAENDFEPFWLA
jgi:hypothetical protein